MTYFLDINVIIDLLNGNSKVLAGFKNAYISITVCILLYSFLPCAFLKAWYDGFVGYQERAFYEHAVCGEQGELFVFAHGGKFFGQVHFPVEDATCVKELF